MKIIARGHNPHITEDLLEINLQEFDGTKLWALDIIITDIESQKDIGNLVEGLVILKECFKL